MNPGRFFMPRIGSNVRPIIGAGYLPARNASLFGKIGSTLRSFNWSGLLNGANKTLNVVNQTIPLVRQAGPMINNMKSMLRIAKVFGNETTSNSFNKKNNVNINNTYNKNINITDNKPSNTKNDILNTNVPNFFI